MTATGATRGERNNNPGNLRDFGISWRGLADPAHDDGGYCRFVSTACGIRALAKDLYGKWSRGSKTIRQIIRVYAPPEENATGAYIADVAARLGIGADEALALTEARLLQQFVTAVIFHENGRCVYATDVITGAVAAALTDP